MLNLTKFSEWYSPHVARFLSPIYRWLLEYGLQCWLGPQQVHNFHCKVFNLITWKDKVKRMSLQTVVSLDFGTLSVQCIGILVLWNSQALEFSSSGIAKLWYSQNCIFPALVSSIPKHLVPSTSLPSNHPIPQHISSPISTWSNAQPHLLKSRSNQQLQINGPISQNPQFFCPRSNPYYKYRSTLSTLAGISTSRLLS